MLYSFWEEAQKLVMHRSQSICEFVVWSLEEKRDTLQACLMLRQISLSVIEKPNGFLGMFINIDNQSDLGL